MWDGSCRRDTQRGNSAERGGRNCRNIPCDNDLDLISECRHRREVGSALTAIRTVGPPAPPRGQELLGRSVAGRPKRSSAHTERQHHDRLLATSSPPGRHAYSLNYHDAETISGCGMTPSRRIKQLGSLYNRANRPAIAALRPLSAGETPTPPVIQKCPFLREAMRDPCRRCPQFPPSSLGLAPRCGVRCDSKRTP